MSPRLRLRTLQRAARNHCPRCGKGAILKNIFVRHDACPHCRMDFMKEDGFYSGAMPINYAIVCVFYLLPLLFIWWFGGLSGWMTVVLCFLGSAVIPVLCYRYSQCLWLGFYHWVTAEDLGEE